MAEDFCVSHPAGHACPAQPHRGGRGWRAHGARLTPPGTPRQSHSCCPSHFSRRAGQSLLPGCPLGTCGGERGESVEPPLTARSWDKRRGFCFFFFFFTTPGLTYLIIGSLDLLSSFTHVTHQCVLCMRLRFNFKIFFFFFLPCHKACRILVP